MSSSMPRHTKASSDALARVNRTMIVELLREEGALSRQQLIARTGLSPATVNRLTAALLQERVIAVAGQEPSNGGRPSVLLRYAGEGRLIAALQVHADGIDGALVDLDGRIVFRRSAPGRVQAADEDGLRAAQWSVLSRLIDALLGVAQGLGAPCVALAVAVPGTVEAPDGAIRSISHIGWAQMPLGAMLRQTYDIPVVIENDANALAFGEYKRGAGAQSLVTVLVQEGVGAGIITNGRLHRGSRYEAGEIGFLLVGRGSLSGSFDRLGALESRLSPDALARQLSKHGVELPPGQRATVEWVLERARGGETGAEEVAAAVLDLVALAVAALVIVLDPEVVVLGDGFGALETTIPAIHARLHHRIINVPRIAPAALGRDGVLIGLSELAAVGVNSFTYLAS